jgi:hypothetical protein
VLAEDQPAPQTMPNIGTRNVELLAAVAVVRDRIRK